MQWNANSRGVVIECSTEVIAVVMLVLEVILRCVWRTVMARSGGEEVGNPVAQPEILALEVGSLRDWVAYRIG